MREIGINNSSCEISAIIGNSIEMVLIGQRVEFRDKFAVLLDCGINHENKDTANQHGRDHLSPFRLVTSRTERTFTVRCQVFIPVSFLE
jgi:hypothetical protein